MHGTQKRRKKQRNELIKKVAVNLKSFTGFYTGFYGYGDFRNCSHQIAYTNKVGSKMITKAHKSLDQKTDMRLNLNEPVSYIDVCIDKTCCHLS